jgi:hypothetical protein
LINDILFWAVGKEIHPIMRQEISLKIPCSIFYIILTMTKSPAKNDEKSVHVMKKYTKSAHVISNEAAA